MGGCLQDLDAFIFFSKPFLVYVFFSFRPNLPCFPTSLLQLLWGFLRFFASPPPSPILSLASRPRALVLTLWCDGLAEASSLAAMIVGYSLASPFFSRLPIHLYQIHRFILSMENEQADAGRDSRTRLTRPNSQARIGTGKYSFSLPIFIFPV